MSTDAAIADLLQRARLLESTGQDEAAKAIYLELLRLDPTHFAALIELGNLALATGHRSAARTAYRQAVQCHPDNPIARVNLGNVYYQEEDLAAAQMQYEAALAVDDCFAEAHQGLARTLDQLGETAAAAPHWQRGFLGRAVVAQRYRGTAPSVKVLLLVSTRLGNVATQLILDDRIFEVTVIHVEYYDPIEPLPPHAVVFNAVGDADLCGLATERVATLLAGTRAPVINSPARVRRTGRVENAQRLGALTAVVAATTRSVARSTLQSAGLTFPLLLRAIGFHRGRHFLYVARQNDLESAASSLPGDELLAIEYLDARGADGMARKYRVMVIDDVLYPLHLAVSPDWKVHYFSAAMADNAAFREQERRFLEDMPNVLGPRAMSALTQIGQSLGLDYCGIDFGLRSDGSVLLFEANATMAIILAHPDPIWDYRRVPISRALDAAKRLVLERAGLAQGDGPNRS